MINTINILQRFRHRILEKIFTLNAKIKFSLYGIEFSKGLKVYGDIILRLNGTARIGNNVRINSAFRANPISSANHTSIIILGGYFK